MKIAFFEIKDDEKKFIKRKLAKHKLLFFKETINEIDIDKIKDFEVISPFIYSKITPEIISKLPKLKLISTRSTGFDHIDLDACNKKDIMVSNVPFYGENTVAEHVFALILSLSRKVHKSYLRTLKDDFEIEGLQGFDLKGKTLGVIGVGHIGLHAIRIAKGFGMHVKAYDLHKDTFISEVLHFDYSDLDDLIKHSDIISLHLPYNKQTHHFLDKKKLSRTKKGVIIINTSRGGVIDTEALYAALKSGHVGGAGLDVIEGEESIKEDQELLLNKKRVDKLRDIFRDKKIFKMDNVIFTHHNAFNSKEAVMRIMQTTIENITGFLTSGTPRYQCNG